MILNTVIGVSESNIPVCLSGIHIFNIQVQQLTMYAKYMKIRCEE